MRCVSWSRNRNTHSSRVGGDGGRDRPGLQRRAGHHGRLLVPSETKALRFTGSGSPSAMKVFGALLRDTPLCLEGKEWELGDDLWRRWMHNARHFPERDAIVHWCADGPSRRWRWNELLEEAQRACNYLRSHGVQPGEVCALIIRHCPQFYPLYMGVVAAGALPAVLATITR